VFWIKGSAVNTGLCTSVKAELWAVVTGLELAWSMGLRRLILETDSAVLVALLLKEYVKADANSALITKARECFV
jgi:ribonuclease HI